MYYIILDIHDCVYIVDVCDNDEIVMLSCSTYYHVIKILPALVRSWHSDLEKRANLLVDK